MLFISSFKNLHWCNNIPQIIKERWQAMEFSTYWDWTFLFSFHVLVERRCHFQVLVQNNWNFRCERCLLLQRKQNKSLKGFSSSVLLPWKDNIFRKCLLARYLIEFGSWKVWLIQVYVLYVLYHFLIYLWMDAQPCNI